MTKSREGRYVWFFDRAGNVAEIYCAATGQYLRTLNLSDPDISLDPTPDLADTAPDGRFIYIAARGPLPLSGDPRATPGVIALELLGDGRTGAVRGLARIYEAGWNHRARRRARDSRTTTLAVMSIGGSLSTGTSTAS